MDLVDERLHAVLTYVDVMDRAGVALDAVQLDAFGARPKPVPGRRRGLRLMSLDDALGPLTAGESTVEYLTRVCWISGVQAGLFLLRSGGRCSLTRTARRFLVKTPDH